MSAPQHWYRTSTLLALPQIEVNAVTSGYSSLAMACSTGNVEIVELLLKHPDINVNSAALHWAVRHGSRAIITMLLQHPGIDVNAVGTQEDFGGMGPLSLACSAGNVEIVELILERPDINVNSAALHWAVWRNSRAIVAMLLRHPDIDVNAVGTQEDFGGSTCLAVACFYYSLALFRCGADPLAVVRQLLLQPRLDMGSVHAALMKAEKKGDRKLMELLKRHLVVQA